MNNRSTKFILSLLTGMVLITSCSPDEKKQAPPIFQYKEFKDSLLRDTFKANADETTNVFDADRFVPGEDSLENLLVQIDTLMHRQAALIDYLDTVRSRVKKTPGYSEEEKAAIRENMKVLDSFLAAENIADTNLCREKNCVLFFDIDKSKQTLYLYVMGELRDSFKVSTGLKKYETPNMSRRPAGPVLTKYTSRKFPGGNYMRLGNMPYAIFIRGGYAIHGTTPGNFAKLGTRASHGCVRVHPDNAKVLNSLVKMVGLQQTWISIRDSIPQ